MGWNLCIAIERDHKSATSLSRHFSYQLLRDYGELRKWLTEREVEDLQPNSVDDIDHCPSRDPRYFLEILFRVRERLEQESEQMPVDHFLWFVDEKGKRWNGSTTIRLPFGGIELKVPHSPMVKLDGGHHNPEHRNELCHYNLRVDPDLLAQLMREWEKIRVEHGFADGVYAAGGSFGPRTNPLVEEYIGWIPAQPILNVLGYQVEVQSVDALSSLRPDLDEAIECCEQAIHAGQPLYWLSE